ncbi:ATP/GTP-binding protein [Corynebacterium auriscanis]|uniref:ATP/GTP-binding protein n=1 Tax=Corynebacterium auriscanis TaxID=99807 RepID=UPI003CF3262C
MTVETTKKNSKHAVDTFDMSAVYDSIIRGERPQPALWSEERRKLSKWKKNHTPEAKRLERIWQVEQGIAPVAYQSTKNRDRWGYRGRGSGRAGVVSALKEWQNVTNIAAAWGPNYVDAPAPAVGMPIGESILTGKEIGFDAFSWYQQGLLGGNPSVFTLSLPGLGKSTMIRKILMGHAAQGQIPIIAGDIKAEYVSIVQRLGGQVITLGHGKGRLNPLDAGALGAIVPRLEDAGADEELIESVREQVHGRQVNMVASLVALGRKDRIEDFEIMAISIALRELMASKDYGWENPPTVQALIAFLERGSDELREQLRAKDVEVYEDRITRLSLSLRSMLEGAVGRIFAGQTTTKIDVTSPAVCIDVSGIDRGDQAMKAAVLMACWSSAFGAIEAAHVMHDAGLARQRLYCVTMDELWQVLAAAPGMVGQTDRLLRLNRTEGIATYLITHTVADLEALPTEQDIKTAKGFVERAGAVICGGLPRDEIARLDGVIPFKDAETDMIASWSQGTEPKRSRTAETPTPPGRGHFMIKPSKDGAAGIPFRTVLTPYEIEHRLHDTNQRFEELFAKVEGSGQHG